MNDSPGATANEKPKRKLPLTPILIGAGVLLVLIPVAYLLIKSRTADDQAPPSTGGPSGGGPSAREVSVVETGAKYKVASAKPTGWFSTGQEADIVLSAIDFNNSGGGLLFHHPGTTASDGTHLLMADKNNNRVLIWNKLPTKNTPPDLVLGQKNLTTNNHGTGLDGMDWPVSVSTGGGKVAVTDSYNNRILLWNSFPTQSGQPADVVINGLTPQDPQASNSKRVFGWPWGVWTNGEKLAITSTFGGNVFLWNTFPTTNDQAADISLNGGGKIGTPRTITSDGKSLIVGDHNARVEEIDTSGTGSMIGNFFWKSWPTKDNTPYDFYMSDPADTRGAWMQGDFTDDGKLVMIGSKLHLWNSFPTNASDEPDLSVGPVEPLPPPPPSDKNSPPQIPENVRGVTSSEEGYEFKGGDGSGLAVAGNKIYISLSNANKMVVYNSIPTRAAAVPDFAIGSDDINVNSLDENYLITNPVPATDGQSLFVSSDFDRKLYVWKNLPDESGAAPDYVYTLPEAPWDNTLYGNVLALAGRNAVYIWKSLPTEGNLPDIEIVDEIGGIKLQNLQGVAYDGTYFYLADSEAGKIYVWKGVPDENSAPAFTIDAEKPLRLSSDGEYLVAVADTGPGWSVFAYHVTDLKTNLQPVKIDPQGRPFNLPQKAEVYQGHLIVGDTSNSQIRIWKSINDALAGKVEDVLLGETDVSNTRPEIGKGKTFWPACAAFDGSYLWLGEFKFSGRLLRYSVR